MSRFTRRQFLQTSAALGAAAVLPVHAAAAAQRNEPVPGERPAQDKSVVVLNPRTRVPIGLIIDDSTCLVNLNRFAVPQFAEAFPDGRYSHPWRTWPVEIPDDFVKKFGQWCGEHGVKGKYSIVPYPACVGRLDRVLPGWTAKEVKQSIDLVRTLMLPNWDIHPEMVTHTRVIDTRTGHPFVETTPRYMENWDWTTDRPADEIADYMRYALTILKNVGLPCEGVTTPGGFGNRALAQLAQATLRACRDVFAAEIPHYFRHLYSSGKESVAPRVEYASGLDTADPKCVVSIIGCTGDWTGGWDCSDRGHLDKFITADLSRGRMVDVIDRGEPAAMVCHWTGIYFNGEEVGFKVFQEVVRRLHQRYDNLLWMKNSEMARYAAAKELTAIARAGDTITLRAPFACPAFTVRVTAVRGKLPRLRVGERPVELTEVRRPLDLKPQTWVREREDVIVCLDLAKGTLRIALT